MTIEMFEQTIDTVTPFELKPNYKFRSLVIINDNPSRLKVGVTREMKKFVRIPASTTFELTSDEFSEFDIDSTKPIFFLGDTGTVVIGFFVFEFRKEKEIPQQIIEITEPIIIRKARDASTVARLDRGRLILQEGK